MQLKTSNVSQTIQAELCLSCEICSAVCPQNAVTMHFVKGEFNPAIDDTLCTNCGLCLSLCPGFDIDPLNLAKKLALDELFSDPYLESYTAYCTDQEIRSVSTSGGLITTIIAELIRRNKFDSVFALNFSTFNNQPARLSKISDINSIIAAAKSKYIPSSVFNIIRALMEEHRKRYIITALPCQVLGIKKFMKNFEISENRLLILGLFCDLNLNFNFIRFMEKKYAKKNERLVAIKYRTKEKSGWPGDMKLEFESGRFEHIDRIQRMQVKKFFQLKRCLCCVDKLNRFADIAFGDCYIPDEEDSNGKSSVIIRSTKGKEAFDFCSHLIKKSRVSIDAINKSQNIHLKNRNIEFIKACSKMIGSNKEVELSNEVLDRFKRCCRYIQWGRDAHYHKIMFFLKWNFIANKFRVYLSNLIAVLAIFDAVVRDLISFLVGSFQKKKFSGDNIIVLGADMLNKGAEAMLFTVVDEIKKRFPSERIYEFSTNDFYSGHLTQYIHTFKILPWEIATKVKVLNFWGHKLIKKNRKGEIERKICKVLKNALCIVDINGYHLHSHWGVLSAFDYLINIIVARRYSIPYFILPQSIGPFYFKIGYKFFLFPLMWLYLKYPLKIFVREKTGIKTLKRFTCKNIKKSRDIVLQKKSYNLTNIYRKGWQSKFTNLKGNAVGLIFNKQVFNRADNDDLYLLYKKVVENLIFQAKNIYMLIHSAEDTVIFESFFERFLNNKQVELFKADYDVVEIERIISQFDFIITSRYHSIINAYKNGVPAIVLGWADKYIELLNDFGQTEYLFDVHDNVDHEDFLFVLNKMLHNYKYEKEKIIHKYSSLKEVDVFGEIEQILKRK